MSIALDLSQSLLASTNKRLGRAINPAPLIYQMTGVTSTTGVLGLPSSTPLNVILGTGQSIVQWLAYGDPSNDPPPIMTPVINVSAVRIR